jgi:ribose transport system substrate-binding protein
MSSSRDLPAGALAVCLACFIAGCQSSPHDPTEKYYLVASNIKLPYWQAAANGLTSAATRLKVQAEMVGPVTYDRKAQHEEFQRIVAKKPSGILVSAADPELMKGDINAAIAAGIPVITMDSDSPASRRLMFVGTNNYEAGRMGARVLAKQLNGKGNVVVFSIPMQANLEERLHGYKDGLDAYPLISIVQVVDIRGDPALAFDKTVEIVGSGKLKVDAFVCLEATSGKEVAEVLNRQKIQNKTVVAMDTDDATLDWIDRGMIVATIGQKPFTMAYFGLKVLDDLHHHKPEPLLNNWAQNLVAPIPAVVDTGATLIDRTNLSEIKKITRTAASR